MEVESNYFSLPFIFHERVEFMEFENNSNMGKDTVAQAEPEKVESTVYKKPKIKPKRKGLKGIIFLQDFRDIKDGIYQDVLEPKIRETIYGLAENVSNGITDTINNTLQMMIFGDVRRTSNQRRPGDKVSYNQYSNRRVVSSPSMSTSYECDDLSWDTRGDAEYVLNLMREHLQEYPWVTVARMYEFAEMTAPNASCNNYGWTNLDGVQVRSRDGGYIIELPRAKPIPR